MNVQRNDLLFSGVVALVGILLLVLWLTAGYPRTLAARIPGQDGAPPQAASGGGEVAGATVVGQPKRGDGTPSSVAGEWLGFRGPHRDGICDDGVRLARQWPAAGPPVLWRIEVGEGYASPAISGGCAYFLDYDEASSADTMRCLSLDDGREIWRNSYPVPITRNHGITPHRARDRRRPCDHDRTALPRSLLGRQDRGKPLDDRSGARTQGNRAPMVHGPVSASGPGSADSGSLR